jgi:hypothetical protein
MKYIIRFISYLPALGVGISSVLEFAMAFDYKWLLMLSICNIIAFIYLLENTENIAANLTRFCKIMFKDLHKE